VAGLLEAIRRYDAELGTPFWAYATWWVRQSMQRFVAEMARPVVLSDRAIRKLACIRDARSQLNRAGNQEPTTEDLMTVTGFARDQIDGLLAVERAARGLDHPLGDEGATLGEQLADPGSADGFERVVEDSELALLAPLVDGLEDRERAIVCARFGLGRPTKTLREVGDVLHVSAERVRQIEEGALQKLRAALVSPAAGSVPRSQTVVCSPSPIDWSRRSA
jgi:RNA polymerase sigma factor (sigma-70 family)